MSPDMHQGDLALDEHGHLRHPEQWSEAWAAAAARADGIQLTPAHWEVIHALRAYFTEFEIAPPIRALIQVMRERTGNPDYGSRELYRLFPESPARQGCRYGGLPRPVSCV